MKKKSLVLITSVMLVALLIAGGTMAWFTATADPVENKFTAGTMSLEIQDKLTGDCSNPPTVIDNVNPGDLFCKSIHILNTGTKRAVVRVTLDHKFLAADGETELDSNVVKFDLDPRWFEHEIDGVTYYIYNKVHGPNVLGGKLIKDNKVRFDGPSMDNDYQGAAYTMTVNAESIQATNGAPAEWGLVVDELGNVTAQ